MSEQVFPIRKPSKGGMRAFYLFTALLGLAPILVMALLAWWPSDARFEVSPKGILVTGSWYGRLIPTEGVDLSAARRVNERNDPQLFPGRRVNGVGLPDYQAGWFALHNAQQALVFLTDRSRAVFVPTTNPAPLLLSPVDPDAFLAALRASREASAPAPVSFPIATAPAQGKVNLGFWIPAFLITGTTVAALVWLALRGFKVTFVLDDNTLRIVGSFYGRAIPRTSLAVDRARIIDLRTDPELRPFIRTSGVGLPNYLAGWFRPRAGGKSLLFVTDRSRCVAVPVADGYTLIVSPADPEAFLAALQVPVAA